MKPVPPATILVVDDVPANLGVLLDTLGRAGHRVLVAESGEGALTQLRHSQPDLILLDIKLPGIDGLETCRRIKALPACATIPVIFLTAVNEPEERVRALGVGAVDYVTKPIHEPEVLARVETHLRIVRLQRSLEEQNEALEEEINTRVEAENQLSNSLDRALVVAAHTGRIEFATQLAATLLAGYFPGTPSGVLPAAVREKLSACGTRAAFAHPTRAGATLAVERHAQPGSGDLFTLTFSEDNGPAPARLMKLGITAREAEVLYWLSEGKGNGDIAAILNTSRRTVEKHVERLLKKLGTENRFSAMRLALDALAGK